MRQAAMYALHQVAPELKAEIQVQRLLEAKLQHPYFRLGGISSLRLLLKVGGRP